MVLSAASRTVNNVLPAPPTVDSKHAGCEIGRSDAETAEIDAVLGRRRAAVGVEAVDDVVAEAGGVVDEGVEATADVDRVIAATADDRVVVVIAAAEMRVVAGTAIDHVVAVIAVEGVVTGTAEQLVGASLPLMMLARALPVPLIASLPVRLRFSTLSTKCVADRGVRRGPYRPRRARSTCHPRHRPHRCRCRRRRP